MKGHTDRAQLPDLMTPAEVAKLFRVNAKTVTRWAQAGKLSSIRTLGKHRRYRTDEVMGLLLAGGEPAASGGDERDEATPA